MTLAEDNVIKMLVDWAAARPDVRAMLLTSTRAVPDAARDALSDYDIILILTDIIPYHTDRAWLAAFGPVLALFRSPFEADGGEITGAVVVQYETGLKIDFSLWPVETLRRMAANPVLDPELDAGYRVLLDKDQLTAGLQPPTFQAYIPELPTEPVYQQLVEEFFLDAGYVAKFIWRDDMMAARHLLDHFMKQAHLRPMLEWHIELAHQWSVKPGPYGRQMKRWLRPDLWAGLEATYNGAGQEAVWDALINTIELMRRVAIEVGSQLGYTYPHELHHRAVAYLERVINLPPDAETFA